MTIAQGLLQGSSGRFLTFHMRQELHPFVFQTAIDLCHRMKNVTESCFAFPLGFNIAVVPTETTEHCQK
ncbi:hypothetical protein [Pseudochrobactrum asaccharolyticum]|uniref:hypothetical protein n=1 Tax=Pseudochrobactrum asaccharolyticum TaxID=354351 RepID=UPI004042BA95